MKLTTSERDTDLWRKISAELDARLKQLRAENDKSMSEAETEKLRGRIAEVKNFISMGVEKPVIEVE